MLLEVCCGNIASVDAAAAAGAPRIELCSRLDLDGLTPSEEDIRTARQKYPSLKIHVLIRPREGDFVYTSDEVALMVEQIETALIAGADGIVIGALTPEGDVDETAISKMISVVDNYETMSTLCHSTKDVNFFRCTRPSVTFHRAFDVCRNPFDALETIIRLGCNRILTSGQAPTALEGAPVIRELQEKAGQRLTVLAGGGVRPDNAEELARLSGCREMHASASALVDGEKVTQEGTVALLLSKLQSF